MTRCSVLQRWLLCIVITGSGLYSIEAKAGTVTNLIPGQSINLSRLLQCGDKSIQVGDKLFSDFSFSICDKGIGCGGDLRASDITIDASENTFGYGLSLQMPLSAS